MHFRVLKTIATSGFLTTLECTKFVFGRDSFTDPAGRDYSAPQDPLAGFEDLFLSEFSLGGGERREGRAREGKNGGELPTSKARGGEGRVSPPQT